MAGRRGSAKAHIELGIRKGFEDLLMGTGGRWDCEKLRIILAKLEGERDGASRAAAMPAAAAAAPMQMG